MAKKLHIEDLVLNVVVDGDPARKEMLNLAKQIKDDNAELKEMQKHLSGIEKLMGGKGSEAYKKQAAAIKQQKDAIEANRQKLKGMRDEMKTSSLTIGELKERIQDFSARLRDIAPGTDEWKKLNVQLRETKQRLNDLQGRSNATGSIMSRLSKIGAGAVAAFDVAVAAIRRVASALRGAFETIKDFEQANVNLATILGKSVQEIESLTNEAERLGRTTEYTASEVTGLQIELAKLGFNEGQIQVMEESILHFATAVGADLPEAASLAGSTLRMFGLSTKDTEDTLATLALATNKSALSFSFFETAMSTVGPVANTFGFGLKDTTALLGSLANAGFDASSAAVATRNILLKLANANGKLAQSLGEPVETFDDLMDGLRKLEDQGIDLAGALELTDARSVAAFTTFLHGTDAAAELRAELEDTDGVLKEIAEQRMNTLDGSLKKLSSAWEGLILKMKNSTGVLKSVVDWLTKVVSLATPGHKHDEAVENAVSTITKSALSADRRADVADRQVKTLQSQLDRLDADLEKASDKRSKRRIKKEKKRIEEELTVYQDAYNRLQSVADAEAEDSTTTIDGNKKKKFKPGLSDKEKKAAAKKAEQTRKKQEKDLKKAAAEAEKARKEVAELEEKALQARIAAATDYDEKANAQIEAENARFEKEKAQYEKKKDAIANYDKVVETIERQHTINLLKIELDRETAQMKQLESGHKQRLAEIQRDHEFELNLDTTSSARKLEIQRDRNLAIAEENKKFLEEQYKFLQTIVSSGEVAGLTLTKEQLDQYKLQLEEIRKQLQDADASLQNLTTSSAWSGSGDGSLFGVKQSDWEAFFLNLEKGTLKAKDLQTVISAIGGAAQEGFKLANQAIQLTNAKEKKALDDYKEAQKEKAKSLKKQLDDGMMREEDYNAEIEKMEKDATLKQEEMELTQAQRAKKIAIAESIINTFLAASKALAQGGWPAGAIMAAAVTALGAAQTLMIKDQPIGYEKGGFVVKRRQDGKQYDAVYAPDKRGYVNGPTFLVGENGGEYVIPAEALKNPDIRLCVDAIESARRSGRLRSLRMEAVNPAAAAYSGRADGGYTREPAPSDVAAISTQTVQDIVRLRETVDRLNGLLDAGIEAEVVMTGRNGLVRRFEEYNRMKERGQL